MQENFVIYNEEYVQIKEIITKLRQQTSAKVVFITDSEGHCIASSGETDDINLNSISSLIAGSVAAVNSIAQLIKIENFSTVLNESIRQSLHISIINERTLLVVIFDTSSNLGLVRYRVRAAIDELAKVFVTINEKLKAGESDLKLSPFEGVSDEDIDRIFGE